MSSSQDVRYSPEKIEQGQRLANKLWNASRLVLLNVRQDVAAEPRPETLEDRWILSRLQRAKRAVAEHVERFDFSHAALGLYDFVYGELCDWYLELVKPRLYDDRDDSDAASATLLHVLGETLAMAHPVIPFVTEEIWSYLPAAQGLLGGASWPEDDAALVDEEAEAAVARQFAAVQEVRRWRDKVNVPPGPRLPARLEAPGYEA